jgi:hypothetical protein
MGIPVILSYGMGVDSSAILARWLLEPESRDFDLDDLVVITAMTGDEFPKTGELVERHILPLLRENRVRYVQVARAGRLQTDGTTVLDDSRNPTRLYIQGAYKLSDENRTQGVLPIAGGTRKCSIHAKGWPLDASINAILEGARFSPGDYIPHLGRGAKYTSRDFRHVIGFNAEETARAAKDELASVGRFDGRQSWYPLITDWGWGRKACEDYLAASFGEPWAKSCCTYCPFIKDTSRHVERLAASPEVAQLALALEYSAMALNANSALFPKSWRRGERWTGTSLRSLVEAAGEYPILKRFNAYLRTVPWAIYHVERTVMTGSTRKLVVINAGLTMDAALAELEHLAATLGQAIEIDRGQARIWFFARLADVALVSTLYSNRSIQQLRQVDTVESFVVAAPAFAEAKENRAFAEQWARVIVEDLANRRARDLPAATAELPPPPIKPLDAQLADIGFRPLRVESVGPRGGVVKKRAEDIWHSSLDELHAYLVAQPDGAAFLGIFMVDADGQDADEPTYSYQGYWETVLAGLRQWKLDSEIMHLAVRYVVEAERAMP